MKAKERAAALDEQDRPLDAIQAYETAIREPDADIETYLNLAVLYFVCRDFGYLTYHRLPNEFVDTAWRRANELLDEAEVRFGRHAEIDFWNKYFRFVVLGEEPFYEECLKLAREGSSLIPYFHLFTSPEGEQYRDEVRRLFESVRDGSTAKKRYIKGIVESRLKAVRRE